MLWSIKKFNKEISQLQNLPQEQVLHPLVKERVKQDVLRSIAAGAQGVPKRTAVFMRRYKFLRYAVSTGAVLSVCTGTAFASTSAKPGDLLFPVKKVTETMRLGLATTEHAKVQLQTEFAENRLQEFESLQAEVETEQKDSVVINEPKHQARMRAEDKAQAEVNNALNALTQVQTRLETKGDTDAGEAVGRTIIKLQARMRASSRKGRDFGKQGDDKQDSGDDSHNIEDEKGLPAANKPRVEDRVRPHTLDNSGNSEFLPGLPGILKGQDSSLHTKDGLQKIEDSPDNLPDDD